MVTIAKGGHPKLVSSGTQVIIFSVYLSDPSLCASEVGAGAIRAIVSKLWSWLQEKEDDAGLQCQCLFSRNSRVSAFSVGIVGSTPVQSP